MNVKAKQGTAVLTAHPMPESPHSSRASPQALLLPCSLWAVWPSAGGLQQPLAPLDYWPHSSSTKWLLSRGELTRMSGPAAGDKVTPGESRYGGPHAQGRFVHSNQVEPQLLLGFSGPPRPQYTLLTGFWGALLAVQRDKWSLPKMRGCTSMLPSAWP